MIFIRNIQINPPEPLPNCFPFTINYLRKNFSLDLTSPVIFFVGENGSGKSTLLESIAYAAKLPVIGGESLETDRTMKPQRELSKSLKLTWNHHPHRGFFLRAEDFYRFANRVHEEILDLENEAASYANKFSGYALQLAQGAILGQKNALENRYGRDLLVTSHGESFLKVFNERFVPKGLYLLDEPESPLSPQRQLAFLSLLKEMTAQGDSQFIISTHSPILMAFPDATIYSFDHPDLEKIPFDDVEHVRLTKEFLMHPEMFLRHL